MRHRLLLPLLMVPFLVHAQGHGSLGINQVHALFNADGMIGRDPTTGSAGYFVPAEQPGPGPSPLYAASLWVAGLDASDALHMASTLYGQEGHDFFPGPLTLGTATIDAATSAAYDRVWSVYRADVERHCAYFRCLNDPECDLASEFPEGYTIPPSFFDWPARGDVTLGQASDLAPFTDFNGDGQYEPTDGDAPCMPGDQALFAIYNDKLSAHTSSGGQPIGLEVHMMPFAYTSGDPTLDRTVFIRYRVINRGGLELHDAYIGLFNDFDLGCPTDDYVQCDVGRSLFFARNADTEDEDCNDHDGYGAQPPAFGTLIIQGARLDGDGEDNTTTPALPAFNGSGFGDGVPDNERYGLCHFMANTAPIPLLLNSAPRRYDWMRSMWSTSIPLVYGGDGYGNGAEAVPATFIFPGSSDPQFLGTNGQPMPAWTEVNALLMPGDRRVIGSMGPITLGPGDEQDLLIAFVYGRATSGGPEASVQDLLQRADAVKTFSEELLADGMPCPCAANGPVSIAENARATLQVFPVPALDRVTVRAPRPLMNAEVRLFDMAGQELLRTTWSGSSIELPLSALAPGGYLVRVASKAGTMQARFVKQ